MRHEEAKEVFDEIVEDMQKLELAIEASRAREFRFENELSNVKSERNIFGCMFAIILIISIVFLIGRCL